jgi:hypothetical protein
MLLVSGIAKLLTRQGVRDIEYNTELPDDNSGT